MDIERIKNFATLYVQNIIEEAVKQSSKSTWLIHCSENCHQINGCESSTKITKTPPTSCLFWAPELNQNTGSNEESCHSKETDGQIHCMLTCNSAGEEEDIYSIPVDTVPSYEENHLQRRKKRHYKCIKPKANYALNLFKSNHKTFNDFKLFLINLYSANDLTTVKKIGSDCSAFTRCYAPNGVIYSGGGGSSNNNDDSTASELRGKPQPPLPPPPNRLQIITYQNTTSTTTTTNNNSGSGGSDEPGDENKKEENRNNFRFKNESSSVRKLVKVKRYNFLSTGIKSSLCKVFKYRRIPISSVAEDISLSSSSNIAADDDDSATSVSSFKDRSLPPVPLSNNTKKRTKRLQEEAEAELGEENGSGASEEEDEDEDEDDHCNTPIDGDKLLDFISNIEKVKEHGWYWGPMSKEAAEKLLANEPDGSFIVRDSSDDRYIFSITFKLNSCIRHVRIEHGQGNFSFGNYTKFKSQTIVDFIENAIQHSKSGRYLFFLHHRPILGPMRVQLLYPVSRFKYVHSLQHACRFVIIKAVRKDLIPSLPLPKSLIEYLSSNDYYTEQRF